jgi:LysM repeat protein
MVALQTTKSNANRIKLVIVAVVWASTILACSQGYITPVELTWTAQASTPIPTNVPLPTATATLTSTATSTLEPPSSLPTFTDVPAMSDTPAPTNTIDPNATAKPPIQYYTQSGDTLPSIMGRFGVTAQEIQSSQNIPATGIINPGVLLIIPDRLDATTPSTKILPDLHRQPAARLLAYLCRIHGYRQSHWSPDREVSRRRELLQSLLALIHFGISEPLGYRPTD